METILLVLLEEYADWEAAYISSGVHLLGQGKFEIKTVSLSTQSVRSIGGLQTIPDYTIDTVPDDYAALLLIGGMRWREECARKLFPLVTHCSQNGRLLGGICDAVGFLAAAGALNAVKHTGNSLSELQWGDSQYKGAAPLEFAREVLLALHVADEALIEDWYALHKLGYYNTAMRNRFTVIEQN